jgi:hypothetical protein
MRSRIDVQVEPLSEQRWAKLERATFARLDEEWAAAQLPRARFRSKAWLAWSFAAGMALAAVAGALVAFRQRAPDVAPPSRIATGAAPSHVVFSGVSLDVTPHSAVVVTGDRETGVLVVVDHGTIACDVEPRPVEAPLIVRAGDVRVRVIGTRFNVTRTPEESRVEVQKGVVEVEAGGQSVRVRAGEAWTSVPPPAEPEHPDDSSGSRAGPGKKPAHATSPFRNAPVAETAKESGARAPLERAPSSQDTYETAARVEANDPAQAIALYRSLEVGGDSWAQNALFAHGRLEATRGNKSEARRVLLEYLSRFPRGANADDARTVLNRLR